MEQTETSTLNNHFLLRAGTFNQDFWIKVGNQSTCGDRSLMLYDLVRKHRLVGMKQCEIHTLLGEPITGTALFTIQKITNEKNLDNYQVGYGADFQLKYSAEQQVIGFRLLQFWQGHRYTPGKATFGTSKWFTENLIGDEDAILGLPIA